MCLPPRQVKRFYTIWRPLLFFVNARRNVVPGLLGATADTPLPIQEVVKIREALWTDDALRQAFVTENPAGLSAADLAMVESWDYRRKGTFFIFRHLKKHSIFIVDKDPGEVFAVKGLLSPMEEVVGPYLPCLVQTVLLPFEDEIIYDSLMSPYNITFGGGIRGNLTDIYRDARERGAVITSLVPAAEPGQADQLAQARATDAKVLEAFRTSLYQSGLSAKVAERDVATVTAFAQDYLAQQAEPHSLREMRFSELEEYLTSLAPPASQNLAAYRQGVTGFKRFLKFLRDTERMEYWEAQNALDDLKRL
jgi:hypothetical protein